MQPHEPRSPRTGFRFDTRSKTNRAGDPLRAETRPRRTSRSLSANDEGTPDMDDNHFVARCGSKHVRCRGGGAWHKPLLAASVTMTLAACGSQAQSSQSSTARVLVTGPLASCSRPSRVDRAPGAGGPEVIGRGIGARLYGLVMAPRFPLVAGSPVVKIVWRMTGSGPLKLAAYDPRGARVALVWGPEAHGGSNYLRPGDEWGSGYRFRHSGCYRLTARRTEGSADVWLRVGPSSH
jgi:hypothetical protein